MDFQRFKTENLRNEFLEAKPFNYLVIDNFFSEPYLNNILHLWTFKTPTLF